MQYLFRSRETQTQKEKKGIVVHAGTNDEAFKAMKASGLASNYPTSKTLEQIDRFQKMGDIRCKEGDRCFIPQNVEYAGS